jgi:uracil phosphoribosyltransferase
MPTTADALWIPPRPDDGAVRHLYGPQVHIHADAAALRMLAILCAQATTQPAFTRLLRQLYAQHLWRIAARHLPQQRQRVATRMSGLHEGGWLDQSMVDPGTRVTVIDVARAGTVPAQLCFETLCDLLDPSGVRQDHLMMSRIAGADHRVQRVEWTGKIDGDVAGHVVIVPDPMGATGSSMVELLRHYAERWKGREALRWVLAPLIVTPEYIRAVRNADPGVHVEALRLDRGNSTDRALACMPGTWWAEESGLTEHDYIVPGGGGFGELLNNTRR